MVKFEQLNDQEQLKIRTSALDWFSKHRDHVYKIISALDKEYQGKGPKIAPSGSDLFHPELWKAIHWKWFLDNSFLL